MFRNLMNIFLVVVFCAMFLQADVHGNGNDKEDEPLLKDEIANLKAANDAWRRNDDELQEMSRRDNTSESEMLEFGQFVADLKHQVGDGCQLVRSLGGDGNQHGIDCVKLQKDPENNKGVNVSDMQREPTREEKAAELTNQLRKLESDLDGLFLKEQMKLKEEKGFGESNRGWGGEMSEQDQEGYGSIAGTEAGSTAEGSGFESRSEIGPEPGETSESGAGAGPNAVSQREPGAGPGMKKEGEILDLQKDAPGDHRDDDVVARQLREAAEAETDPILKERLWEEYRKYKKSK